MNDMMNIIAQYQLSVPPSSLLLIKALSHVEGLGYQLDPEFNLIQVAQSFIINQYRRRFSLVYWNRCLKSSLADLIDFLSHLPTDLNPLYNIFRSDRFKRDFNLEGLDELCQTIDRFSHRFSFAIILASLVISSSLVVHAKVLSF